MASVRHPDMEQICKEFADYHNIVMEELFENEAAGIYWLAQTKFAVDEALRTRAQELLDENEPTWAILHSMLDRVYELNQGAMVALVTGVWPLVEITARVAIEASVNAMYILSEDSALRIVQYLSDYFEKQQSNLDKWGKVIPNLTDDEQKRWHQLTLQKTRESLNIRDEMVQLVLRKQGFVVTKQSGWPPNVFEKFRALGMQASYRTTYAALSSQVHNDADSLVDYIVARSFSDERELLETAKEFFKWMRLHVYQCLSYYIQVAREYVKAFGLNEANHTLLQAQSAINHILDEISEEIPVLNTQVTSIGSV